MPLDDIPERTQEELDNGPTPNGDAASWFYVLGGLPMMIVFFVVMFSLVGTCDSMNILLPG